MKGWWKEADTRQYRVVVNQEEQYSVWFEDKAIPEDWADTGFLGTKTECLNYIYKVWTDLRPLSFRKKMALMTQSEGPPK